MKTKIAVSISFVIINLLCFWFASWVDHSWGARAVLQNNLNLWLYYIIGAVTILSILVAILNCFKDARIYLNSGSLTESCSFLRALGDNFTFPFIAKYLEFATASFCPYSLCLPPCLKLSDNGWRHGYGRADAV